MVFMGLTRIPESALFDCRLYLTRSNHSGEVVCFLWIRGSKEYKNCAEDFWADGYGEYSGYGSDRYSAAAFKAFRSAGVIFNEVWDDNGIDEIPEAIKKVCENMGCERFFTHKAHG